MMKNDFYVALEERFRGSRELISARLQVYLPFVEPLKEIYPAPPTIDLGCGRGEWLEILGERGFQAQGVDLNDGMLSACRDLGLKVQTGDALSFLKKLPDESQVIVSAFHLVEHIPFEDLQEVVKESFRVLKPAGLLILETPNPENIIVGTSSFYMDPTHTSPIPPNLLAFLPEYYGYHNTKILRLQETPQIRNLENLNLFDVFNGSSPDYAVVAQKCGTKKQLELTKHAFQAGYGTTQAQLAMAYDKDIKTLLQQAAEDTKQIQDELQAIYNSRSWRITSPLRKFAHQVRIFKSSGFYQQNNAIIKKILRSNISRGIAFLNSQPRLRHTLISTSKAFGLYNVFYGTYQRYVSTTQTLPEKFVHNGDTPHRKIAYLSPHAHNIYNDLMNEIANQKKNDN